jgi:hypothetical protein
MNSGNFSIGPQLFFERAEFIEGKLLRQIRIRLKITALADTALKRGSPLIYKRGSFTGVNSVFKPFLP